MQFNAASASSSSAASATAATHNYFDAAVDVDGLIFTKSTDSLFSSKGGKQKESAQITENVRFPTPEDSGDDHEGGDVEDNIRPSLRPRSHMQSPPRPGRSVAPSPAPTMLPQPSEYIERLYALEAEQAEEIRTLAKEVLFAAYQTFLSTPGDLAGQYCKRIAELLGEGVESRVVEDVEDIKETRRLPERQPAWDFGSLGARTTDTSASVATPKRSSMPPPAFVPSRKRLREEDSLEDVLEVENSLSLSRNPSIGTISSSGDSPASKRPRLETYVPTVDEREDDAMLGLIWGRWKRSTRTTPEATWRSKKKTSPSSPSHEASRTM
ncbi:hypothetical protein NLJ89_g8541 [Agrocybe chaxingu]|uniref:Uncharacterized protein n=1 Tax=Agrocybe chaxingu TaxID=84603 RepID=A0A9W8K297_9AGAR|nr:hypothetical protein NLJ89_g8541 [Agrocybe chaxingu]